MPYFQSTLTDLCGFGQDDTFELIYRATRDGFSARDFHSKCDGSPNTLTIVRSSSGSVFGGFAQEAWSSSDEWVDDPASFVFKVTGSEGGSSEIGCSATSGPRFSRDICIASDSNVNEASYSDFGRSFQHGAYLYGTVEAMSTILADEIEVFTRRE